MKKSMLILIVAIITILISCNDDKDQISNTGRSFQYSLQSVPDVTQYNDLIETFFYEPNLVGVIELNSNKRNDLSISKDGSNNITYHEADFIDNYAYAGFRDYDLPVTLENLVVNASLLREYAPGAYAKVGSEEMDIYFDGSTPNKYYLECLNNSIVPDSVYDQVVFSNRIEVTNVLRYDTLYRSQLSSFQINWTGGPSNGYAVVNLNVLDPDIGNTNDVTGFYNVTENTGSHSFDSAYANVLSNWNCYYELKVECWEPIIKPLSNGNKVCLLGISSYTTTIYLKDDLN